MIPVGFNEENFLLHPPKGTEETVEPLSVWIGHTEDGVPLVVSCWKLTIEELETLNRSGRIWLTVMGTGMQPVQLSAFKPLSERPQAEEKDEGNP